MTTEAAEVWKFSFTHVLPMAVLVGLDEIYDFLEQLTDVLIIVASETLMVLHLLFWWDLVWFYVCWSIENSLLNG